MVDTDLLSVLRFAKYKLNKHKSSICHTDLLIHLISTDFNLLLSLNINTQIRNKISLL